MSAPNPSVTPTRLLPALRFRRLTRYYDAVVGATTRERTFKHALIDQAQIEAGHHVLDVGAGTGTLAIWAKQREPGATVVGVDGDPEIVALARAKATKADVTVQLDRAMSYDLPYPSACFDRALSSLFFHHLRWEDKVRTAQEIFRVLKPGASLHVADWGRPTNTLMRGLVLSVQLLDGFATTRDNVAGRLVDLFRQAGFVDVALRRSFGTMYGTLSLYSAFKPLRTSEIERTP